MIKIYQLLIILTLLIGNLELSAQEPWPDSLKEIHINIDGKELKIRMDVPAPPPPPPGLDSMARIEYIKIVKGLDFLKEIRPQFNKRKHNEREWNFSSQKINLDSILQALEITAKHLEKEGNTEQLNLIHKTMGEMHRRSGAPRFAIESFEEVHKMAEKKGDWRNLAEAKANIGQTHLKNKKYEKALFFLEDALKIYQDLEQKKGSNEFGDQLPWLHNLLGQAYQGLSKPDKAKAHYQKAIELGKAIGDEENVCYANTHLGSVYQEQKLWNKAMEHYKASCNGFESAKDEEGKARGYNLMGSLYLDQGNYDHAEAYFKKALTAAEMAQDKEQAMESFLLLSKSAKGKGNTDKAYEYYQKYEQYKDSLFEAKRNLNMAILEQRYDAEKKEVEVQRLAKERYLNQMEVNRLRSSRNFSFAGTGLLLLLVFGIWQRSKYQRQKEQASLEQQRVEQLEQLDRLKDEFLANTSHELRTPLNGIIGLAESLVDGAAGALPQNAVGNLNMIATSGRRLSSLVNDILDFSKLKNNELVLQQRPLDLNSVAEIVIALSVPLVTDKDIVLRNDIPKDLPLADADENRVQQILHNLVGNALKFTEKGSIRVWAAREEDWLAITVSDTGIGIPPEKQALIFQSFEQADGSVAREYGGTGLGLTVTKKLVELHGGSINVLSEPGEGAHFTFTLPISTEEQKEALDSPEIAQIKQDITPPTKAAQVLGTATPLATAPLVAAALPEEENIRILIVDDEPVNLQVLQNHLSLQGYEVIKAANGPQALEILDRDKHFDLIILDIMMPRMSGYVVCQKLRELYPPSELPIVMLTAKNRVTDLVEGFQVGANDYLTKPFSKDELLSRIKTHLRLHSIHRASGKFVPFEFLRSIGRETITDVKLGDQTEKVVTVYFSDIRDYTSMSESMTPSENFKFVNALNRRMGPIIRRQGGFVNQYLGDAIMAIFPEHPVDALKTAIDMQQELRNYNEKRKNLDRSPIRIGIGMHTGPLIMGIIGDDKRLDAATISDTVNTASRIESLTKFYGANILLSEDSLPKSEIGSRKSEVSDDFQLRFLGPVLVKGKQEPVGLYECFNGDYPRQVALKHQTLNRFQEAMDLYFSKDFASAVKLFREILKVNPEDQVARHFLNKATYYRKKGVATDWTGLETMASK